jgi:hypothetical protein
VTGFYEALVRSLAVSGLEGAANCTLTAKELLQPDALFLLAAKVVDIMKRTPVFLIDMGPELESADTDSILKLADLLRLIANNKDDKNIPFALGLGWTVKFFGRVVSIRGDVFRDRYRARRTLGNSFESDAPFEVFQSIVKDISGADIPQRFSGLLRVPELTAGKYGENLLGLKTKGEVSSKLAWEALCANDWKIIQQLTYPDTQNFTAADLAELLLADGRLAVNPCPGYLEQTASNSFVANDKLYERFGLLPPRRDPTALERFRNRLNDPEDSDLVNEIAQSITGVLNDICHAENIENKLFSLRSAIVSASLKELPPTLDNEIQGAPELDQNIDAKVLPKRLAIGIYLDSPDAQEFEQAMSAALKRGDFLIVCHPQGVIQSISETELFRIANNEKKPFFKTVATEGDLCTLVNRSLDESKCNRMIVEWINYCLSQHLKKRPAIPLLSDSGSRALGAIIAGAGKLKEEDLRSNLTLSKAECSGLIARLNEVGIITKKKGVLYWDPSQDPVLRSLLDAGNDTQKLISQLCGKFTLSNIPIDPNNLMAAYSGVFQGKQFGMIKEGDLLSWYGAHRPQLLNVVLHLIDGERELTAFRGQAQSLHQKVLDDWQDIAGDRLEIDTLLTEVQENKEKIELSRKNAADELQQVKASLKKSVQESASYFSDADREDMLIQIDGLRTAGSSSIRQLKNKIENKVNQVETSRRAIAATKTRLQELRTETGVQLASNSNELTRQIDELLGLTEIGENSPKQVELDKSVDELERKILKAKIVTTKKSLGSPPQTITSPPVIRTPPVLPPPPIATEGNETVLPPPPTKTDVTSYPVLPPPPIRTGTRNKDVAPEPPPEMFLREPTGNDEIEKNAEEDKEQIFDISRSDQARKLAEILLSPRVKIKKIRVSFS